MNSKSRILRSALLAVTLALAVASVPAAGGAANAAPGPHSSKAILKAISHFKLKPFYFLLNKN